MVGAQLAFELTGIGAGPGSIKNVHGLEGASCPVSCDPASQLGVENLPALTVAAARWTGGKGTCGLSTPMAPCSGATHRCRGSEPIRCTDRDFRAGAPYRSPSYTQG